MGEALGVEEGAGLIRVLVTPASCYLSWGGGGQDPDGQSLGWREESWQHLLWIYEHTKMLYFHE